MKRTTIKHVTKKAALQHLTSFSSLSVLPQRLLRRMTPIEESKKGNYDTLHLYALDRLHILS
jgi:hypothetical protein